MAKGAQRIELLGLHDTASPAEAAAVVAALERFMRETAPFTGAPEVGVDPWRRAALLEGVGRDPVVDVPDSWINA
jgi:hypothetical protein